MVKIARPYVAAFSARFLLMLQYRAAAIAGFLTQCWWGAIKIMVYAAFYRASAASVHPAISLAQVATYTWLNQGLLALMPWGPDPEVSLAMRTGVVMYDRLRPVDAYAYWYARAAAFMTSRALPRAVLMSLVAGVVLPLAGVRELRWTPPPTASAAALFAVSLLLMTCLSSAFMMLLNIAVVVTLNDRWVSQSMNPLLVVLSGSLVPLALYPDWAQRGLFFQPFAGVVDIPFRIYSGNLAGVSAAEGLALQLLWTGLLVVTGRAWMERVMRRLEVQGG
jgi:ABC-2 type transport system permease protein